MKRKSYSRTGSEASSPTQKTSPATGSAVGPATHSEISLTTSDTENLKRGILKGETIGRLLVALYNLGEPMTGLGVSGDEVSLSVGNIEIKGKKSELLWMARELYKQVRDSKRKTL